MTLVPLALEKGPRRDKCNAFRLSFLPSVGSLSVVRLVPCVCDRKPPKKVWTFCCLVPTGFSGVPNALRIVADQTKATAECGAAMWLAGDNAW